MGMCEDFGRLLELFGGLIEKWRESLMFCNFVARKCLTSAFICYLLSGFQH